MVAPKLYESKDSAYLFILALLTALLACVGGCSNDEMISEPQSQVHSQTDASQNLGEASSEHAKSKISIDVAALLRFNRESTRSLALRLQLGTLTQSSLQDVLLQSTDLPSNQLQLEVQSLAIRELALISPESALNSIEGFPPESRSMLVRIVFQVWSISNLDQAIQSANDLQVFEKLAAVEGILLSRDDLSVVTQQDLAREILGEDYSDFRIDELFLDETIDDPELAWSEFISRHEHELKQLPTLHIVHLANIAGVLESSMGAAVFDKIQRDVPSGPTRLGVIVSVLDKIARNDPSRAFKILTDLNPEGMQFLAARIASTWAQSDPESALNAVAVLEATGLRTSLQHAVLLTWVEIDPFDVMDEIERVPPNLRALTGRRAMTSIAFSSPQQASKMLHRLEDNRSKQIVGEAIVTNWAQIDFQAALNWVQTSPQIGNSKMRQDLMATAFATLARSDPEAAFKYALDEEVGTSNVGLESSVVLAVAVRNLDKGIELLSRVRDERTKEHAIHSIGESLVKVGESQKALELTNQLQLENRGRYLESLAPSLLHNDPSVLADHVDSLPSHQARSRTAGLLLTRYRGKSHVFTDEQIEKLRKYVDDDPEYKTLFQ